MRDKILALADSREQLTFKTIRPYLGISDKMQDAYVHKYEHIAPSKFPKFNGNEKFVGIISCQHLSRKDGVISQFETKITSRDGKFWLHGTHELMELAPYHLATKVDD